MGACTLLKISSEVRMVLHCIFTALSFDFIRDPSIIGLLFALSFELCKAGSDNRIHNLFERALTDDKLQKSVLLWRCYLAYEAEIACNASAARRVFFRAIHACPWYGTEICCRNLMFLWLYLHDCLFYHPSISSYFYVANLEQRSFICFLLHLYLILTLYY